MGTDIGEYIGTTLGIHSPIPYKTLDSKPHNPKSQKRQAESFLSLAELCQRCCSGPQAGSRHRRIKRPGRAAVGLNLQVHVT